MQAAMIPSAAASHGGRVAASARSARRGGDRAFPPEGTNAGRRGRPLSRARALRVSALDVRLRSPKGGAELSVGDGAVFVGFADGADDVTIALSGDGLAGKHARLEKRNGRLFCTALVGDGNMMADTRTWLNGSQLRSGVGYVVPSGGVLAFGSEDCAWVAEFQEAAVNDMMAKMMMKAMAQGASEEVRNALKNMDT